MSSCDVRIIYPTSPVDPAEQTESDLAHAPADSNGDMTLLTLVDSYNQFTLNITDTNLDQAFATLVKREISSSECGDEIPDDIVQSAEFLNWARKQMKTAQTTDMRLSLASVLVNHGDSLMVGAILTQYLSTFEYKQTHLPCTYDGDSAAAPDCRNGITLYYDPWAEAIMAAARASGSKDLIRQLRSALLSNPHDPSPRSRGLFATSERTYVSTAVTR